MPRAEEAGMWEAEKGAKVQVKYNGREPLETLFRHLCKRKLASVKGSGGGYGGGG